MTRGVTQKECEIKGCPYEIFTPTERWSVNFCYDHYYEITRCSKDFPISTTYSTAWGVINDHELDLEDLKLRRVDRHDHWFIYLSGGRWKTIDTGDTYEDIASFHNYIWAIYEEYEEEED